MGCDYRIACRGVSYSRPGMTEPKGAYNTKDVFDEVSPAIQFWAVVYKVQTLADHGIRLTLDMPEDAILTMAQLVECKRRGVVLSFTAGQLLNSKEQKNDAKGLATRPKRKSAWTPPEEKGAD